MSGCLATVGELAQHGIWYAAQLSAGVGLWLLCGHPSRRLSRPRTVTPYFKRWRATRNVRG
jgi:hypothetical protein